MVTENEEKNTESTSIASANAVQNNATEIAFAHTTTQVMLTIFSIINAIITGALTLNSNINGIIASVGSPPVLNFYFLFFYALLAACLGGIFWLLLVKLNEIHPFMKAGDPLGGKNEPHGIATGIWAVTSTLPLVLVLIYFNLQFHFVEVSEQSVLSATFLAGAAIGAWIFYDVKGYRRAFNADRSISFIRKELWLAFLWSFIIAGFAFVLQTLFKAIFYPQQDVWKIAQTLGIQVGITIAAVWFVVAIFLTLSPTESKFETARGVLAGVALRCALFFGFFMAL